MSLIKNNFNVFYSSSSDSESDSDDDEVDTRMQCVDVHNHCEHDVNHASPMEQYSEQYAWLFKHGWGDRCI